MDYLDSHIGKRMFIKYINEDNRQAWLKHALGTLPKGARLLDAGAGELKNKSTAYI